MAVTSVGTTTTTPSTSSTSATTASSSTSSSTSSSPGTLSAAGVGSGLDVMGLESQLMTMEQKPLNLLVQQEVGMQAKLSNLGTVKSAIASLQSAAQALSTASVASYSANSSDSTRLTATATADASLGANSIDITQLPQPQKLVAAGMASMTSTIGSGTLKFTMGTVTAGPPHDICRQSGQDLDQSYHRQQQQYSDGHT